MKLIPRIKDRVAVVLGERIQFNEILSVMYREGQKMSWHDDGEDGTSAKRKHSDLHRHMLLSDFVF
jgi:alkylated DNA repair dioxygenase AlkB